MLKSRTKKKETQDSEIQMIENLMELLKNKNLTEVAYESKGFNVIVKGPYMQKKFIKKESEALKDAIKEENCKYIKSSNIGMYFYKDSNGKSKIAKGQSIKKGEEIGYVLTLGVKNAIRSSYSGKIQEIFVDNGSPVDFGKDLIKITEE